MRTLKKNKASGIHRYIKQKILFLANNTTPSQIGIKPHTKKAYLSQLLLPSTFDTQEKNIYIYVRKQEKKSKKTRQTPKWILV